MNTTVALCVAGAGAVRDGASAWRLRFSRKRAAAPAPAPASSSRRLKLSELREDREGDNEGGLVGFGMRHLSRGYHDLANMPPGWGCIKERRQTREHELPDAG